MNRIQFKNVLLKQSPELSDRYGRFCQLQDMMRNTLNEFCTICDENNIPYQLAYGSLLGVIRDGGQIPWDYDIDVFVPLHYRKRLINALMKTSQAYYFDSIETNKRYPSYIVRFVPQGYNSDYLHVDIFFLIKSSPIPSLRKDHARRIKELYLKRYYKYFNPWTTAEGNFKAFIKLLFKKIQNFWVDIKKNDADFFNEAIKYEDTEGVYITGDKFSEYYSFPAEIMDTELLRVDGFQYSVPKNYDLILRMVYGDYKKEPTVSNAIDEFTSHLELIEKNGKKRK